MSIVVVSGKLLLYATKTDNANILSTDAMEFSINCLWRMAISLIASMYEYPKEILIFGRNINIQLFTGYYRKGKIYLYFR